MRGIHARKGVGARRGIGLGSGKDAILYSTGFATFANDGDAGKLSPFARHLLIALATEGLELRVLASTVAEAVAAETGKTLQVPQRPELIGALGGAHYFRPPKAP